ncbi:MAG TPA: response regulator transcription factor [Vicinamibacterales bacterium]|nr:response regulator transcription factor [Vicinamibacterales bacterium]
MALRAILVGTPSERARLKAEMNGSLRVVGEFASLPEARAASLDADAILIAKKTAEPRADFEETLTPREVEVLDLLAQGLPNKAIAARLGISDQTVKFHVSSISGKLGASNRTDAVRRAVRRGLITL